MNIFIYFQGISNPPFIVYDDACHLKRYIDGRTLITWSDRLNSFQARSFAVDKMHIKGHTEKWCHDNCHPKLFPQLKDANTMVCEQVNAWLKNYKFIVKYMNAERFNFYLYSLFNEYNKIKLSNKQYTLPNNLTKIDIFNH